MTKSYMYIKLETTLNRNLSRNMSILSVGKYAFCSRQANLLKKQFFIAKISKIPVYSLKRFSC